MRICTPTAKDQGLDSIPYGHFGSAPLCIITDTESGDITTVDNSDREHEHGRCRPAAALDGVGVDAVIVGGIGRRALARLADMGIAVYQAGPGTLAENLAAWQVGRLSKMDARDACSGHGHHAEPVTRAGTGG